MNETRSSSPAASPSRRRWYQKLGPALITACVVIGPGSILTSSKVGAKYGYGMSWVVAVAVLFMMVYMMLGARLGVVASESPGKLVADRIGRWMAVCIGIGVFFISAAFQFGNNLGVHSAFSVYHQHVKDGLNVEFDSSLYVIVFNSLSIVFLFGFKNLYRAIEKLMMFFVAVMLIAFAVNLVFAQPNVGELLAGFIPGQQAEIPIEVLGLIGTTFVVTAAYFQCYLVRQKGWTTAELKDGLVDARVGSVIMAVITLMIMSTAAAVLRDESLGGVADVARQLVPLFGEKGQALFCIGLFSAAYSSFLVNSMIGGFILSDGLGLGSKPTDMAPKVLTTAVLLTGMGVALFVIETGIKPFPAIVAAQAVTVLATPLMAGALLWMTNRKDIMGDQCNSLLVNIIAGIGFLLLLAMAWYTAMYKVAPQIQKWVNGS